MFFIDLQIRDLLVSGWKQIKVFLVHVFAVGLSPSIVLGVLIVLFDNSQSSIIKQSPKNLIGL
jgi:hypothetical protein